MDSYLLAAVVTLGIAVFVNLIFKRFELPLVIGYILSGTLIVYLFDIRGSEDSHVIMEFAELGIVFLMFMIGLEFSAQKIKSMKKEVGLYGFAQVFLTASIFFILSYYLLGFCAKVSVVIALAFTLSSTAIVLKSFNETREIYTPYGKNSLGILIFQDIAVIPIMLIIAILANSSEDVESLLGKTVISAIFVLFLLLVVGKFVIEKLLKYAAKTGMDEIFVGSLLFVLIGASMLAHYFGFSYSLGAFIAGMIIAETKYKYKAEADLSHFRDLLLGLFFLTVGFHIDLLYLFANLWTILAVLIVVMGLKSAIIYSILIFSQKKDIALKSALALSQVGEFSFAIFYIATKDRLLDNELYNFLLLVVVLSMIITPFLLKYMNQVCMKLFQKESCNLETPQNKEELNDHIIVCGYGTLGREIVDFLKKFEIRYICVDDSIHEVEEGLRRGDNIFLGSMVKSNTLHKLRAEFAVAAIVVDDDKHVLRVICERLLDINPNLHIIVRVMDDEDAISLNDLKIYKTVNGKKEIGKKLAQAAVSCEFKKFH